MIRAAVIFVLLVVSAHAAVDVDRLVDALREREEWNGRDGAHGERGPWQITPAVWRLHMPGISFAEARCVAVARACAVKHVNYLAAQLEARGVAPLLFNIALAWNAGINGSTRGTAPERAYHFAVAVENIYHARSRSQLR
ncbi:MAG: hypothetical protein KF715_08455 [Candidatus Didemnitutus sp.]|nr:hypothetical protein [Candidatus Didemnitutus sp.]